MPTPSRTRLWLLSAVAVCLVVVGLAVRGVLVAPPGPLDAVRSALADGQTRQALGLLDDAFQQAPASAEIAFLRARCHRRLAETPAFRRQLSLAANLGYSQAAIEREQTLLRVQQGTQGVASAEVSALLASPGDDTVEIYEAIVRGCLLSTQLEEAELFLDGWLADYPEAALPWFYRGLLLEAAGRWSQASAAFAQAIARGIPSDYEACRHQADVLRNDHHYREAIVRYEQCGQSTAAVLLGKAACLETLGEIDAARDVYRELLGQFPDNPAALSGAGRLAARRGEHVTARQLLEQAVARAPSDVQAWRTLGWSLVSLGEPQLARDAFKTAVQLTDQIQRSEHLLRRIDEDPKNPRYRIALARIMLDAGRTQDGLQWLNSVLQIDPTNIEARNALDEAKAASDSTGADDTSSPDGPS